MITFKRYLHIEDLITHYANTSILQMISTGISNTSETEYFVRFIWLTANQMAIGNNNTVVLGATDNTDLMQ